MDVTEKPVPPATGCLSHKQLHEAKLSLFFAAVEPEKHDSFLNAVNGSCYVQNLRSKSSVFQHEAGSGSFLVSYEQQEEEGKKTTRTIDNKLFIKTITSFVFALAERRLVLAALFSTAVFPVFSPHFTQWLSSLRKVHRCLRSSRCLGDSPETSMMTPPASVTTAAPPAMSQQWMPMW